MGVDTLPRHIAGILLQSQATGTGPQFALGTKPVRIRRPLHTAPRLPQPKRIRSYLLMAGDLCVYGLRRILMHQLGVLESGFGMLKRFPGTLMSARVILLFMADGRATMSVRCDLVQFRGTPMIVEVA